MSDSYDVTQSHFSIVNQKMLISTALKSEKDAENMSAPEWN